MFALVLLGTALLLALSLAAAIAARLLRPSNLQAIITGDVPTLQGIKGRFKFFGQEFEAVASMDDPTDRALREMGRRLDITEAAIDELTRDRKAVYGKKTREP